MTSKFKSQDIEARVKQCLDEADQALPEQVCQDLSQARVQALAKARLVSSNGEINKALNVLHRLYTFSFSISGASLAVAALLVVLVSYWQTDTNPEFPGELLIANVPMEDFALLEDLEFASWLAEQQEVLH